MANVVKHPTLYKRTATGAVQTWWIEDETIQYRMCSGQLDGAITRSEWTTVAPKNVGRANETTEDQQCAFEIDAAYKKKLKAGYVKRLEDCKERVFHVMLAHPLEEKRGVLLKAFEDKVTVGSQPKLDGIRCVSRRDGFLSRKNTTLFYPHVREALSPIFAQWPKVVIDGEIYNHEFRNDFEQIASMARRTKLSVEEAQLIEQLEYHIYDIVEPGEYARREEMLRTILDFSDSPFLKLVPTTWVDDQKGLDVMYEHYLEQGYEGQMIRLPGEYEQKRSSLLLKRKEFIDKEYVVIDIEEGVGNKAGMAGFVVLRLKKQGSETFKAGLKFSREKCRELLVTKARYIGGEATIRFQNYTAKGVPRFPRATKFHPGGRKV